MQQQNLQAYGRAARIRLLLDWIEHADERGLPDMCIDMLYGILVSFAK